VFKVIFYTPFGKTSPVEKYLYSLNLKQEAKVTRALGYLKEYGISKSILNLRKVAGTPFWELRILGKDNIRVICASIARSEIIVLHIFIKKQRKTPVKELNIAMKRYKTAVDR